MIGYYAHHQGAGHLTRLQSIAARPGRAGLGTELRAGTARAGRPGWTQLARDDDPDPGSCRGRHGDPTAHGVLHWAPRGHAGLARRPPRSPPGSPSTGLELLVVDVSVEVALLARLCGVPTVVVAMPGLTRGPRPPARLRHGRRPARAVAARGRTTPAGRDEWVDKAWFVGGISQVRPPHPAPTAPALRRSARRRDACSCSGVPAAGRTTAAELDGGPSGDARRGPGSSGHPATAVRPRLWDELQRGGRGGHPRRAERRRGGGGRPSSRGGRRPAPSLRRAGGHGPADRATGRSRSAARRGPPPTPGRRCSRLAMARGGGGLGPLVDAVTVPQRRPPTCGSPSAGGRVVHGVSQPAGPPS